MIMEILLSEKIACAIISFIALALNPTQLLDQEFQPIARGSDHNVLEMADG